MAKGRTKRSTKKNHQTKLEHSQEEVVLSVIVLSFNTKNLTLDCLASLFKEHPSFPWEVIVVDNASTDRSYAEIKKRFGNKVKLVRTVRNIGYGPGNNLGAEEAWGQYLLFLNSDTLVLPGALDRLVEFADQHPTYGIVAPQILLKDKKYIQPASYGHLPTLFNLLIRNNGNKKHQPNKELVVTDTDWVTGAALMIPTDLFAEIGCFDSRYFMYFEDQDLCATVKREGYEIGVVSKSQIIHLGGQSLVNKNKRYEYYDDSQNKYFLKHHGWFKTAILYVLRLPWRAIRGLTRRSPGTN